MQNLRYEDTATKFLQRRYYNEVIAVKPLQRSHFITISIATTNPLQQSSLQQSNCNEALATKSLQ